MTSTPPQPPAASTPLRRRLASRGVLAAISLGGAAGALARLALNQTFAFHGGSWPWATFIANLAGSALLAFLLTVLERRAAPATLWHRLLATGFCGALTTFSTFQLELVKLTRHGHPVLALAYAAGSLAGALLAVGSVTWLARGRRWAR